MIWHGGENVSYEKIVILFARFRHIELSCSFAFGVSLCEENLQMRTWAFWWKCENVSKVERERERASASSEHTFMYSTPLIDKAINIDIVAWIVRIWETERRRFTHIYSINNKYKWTSSLEANNFIARVISSQILFLLKTETLYLFFSSFIFYICDSLTIDTQRELFIVITLFFV